MSGNITVLLTSVNTMLLLYSCCTCWFTVTVVKLLFGNGIAGLSIRESWRRHSGNYCDDHCSSCSAESASLPKVDFESILSTDSTSRSLHRFDQSTRLEPTLSIDSTSALIDRLDRFQGLIAGEYNWQIGRANHSSGHTIVLWYCEWVTEIRYNLS